MTLSVIVTLGITLALAFVASDTTLPKSQHATDALLAQATTDAPGEGIGLTESHKRIIYDRIASEQEQTFSGGSRLAIGDTIPDSVMLNAVPISVKDQVGLLRDFKFVKAMDSKILLVDPANRKIVDIITKQDAGR
jgi:hypothetical protein